MRQCTFKAIDIEGNTINRLGFRMEAGQTYENAVIEACIWFERLNKAGLHLRTTAPFKERQVTEESLNRLATELRRICPLAYGGQPRQGKNHVTIDLLNETTQLLIMGSAIPEEVDYPWAGKNHNIYCWIDERKKTNLMKCVTAQDYLALQEGLENLHIAMLDLAEWCVHAAGSSSDDDILAYSIDNTMIERIKASGLTKNQIVSVSGNVEETMQAHGIMTKYRSLVWNPKREEWFKIIDELHP